MTKYTIVSLEQKTSSGGKPYARVVLQDDSGAQYTASMWDSFADLAQGGTVEGDMVQKGNFTNFKRHSAIQRPKFMGGGAVTQAQDHKAELVSAAQDKKHDAIAKAGAFRDGTLVTLAELKDMPFPTEADFKARWEYWVKYFLGKHNEPFL